MNAVITDIKDMPTDQLEARRDVVESELAAIKAKLDKARADRHITGEYADPDWYRRATTRLRFLGAEHQHLCREIGGRKRALRLAAQNEIDRQFVAQARIILSRQQFDTILDCARRAAGHG